MMRAASKAYGANARKCARFSASLTLSLSVVKWVLRFLNCQSKIQKMHDGNLPSKAARKYATDPVDDFLLNHKSQQSAIL
jgi:hypothetical protein